MLYLTFTLALSRVEPQFSELEVVESHQPFVGAMVALNWVAISA
jgi:hypothetical protein